MRRQEPAPDASGALSDKLYANRAPVSHDTPPPPALALDSAPCLTGGRNGLTRAGGDGLGPAQRPQYISNVLAAFLGPQGLQHPNRLVSGRASYLFMRLVKALRGQLGPYMEMVRCHRSISLACCALWTLRPALISLAVSLCVCPLIERVGDGEQVMNHLVAALPIVLSTTVKAVNPNPLKANNASSDDHLYVLEAAGLLIGYEETKLDVQSAYLQALLSPLRQVCVCVHPPLGAHNV